MMPTNGRKVRSRSGSAACLYVKSLGPMNHVRLTAKVGLAEWDSCGAGANSDRIQKRSAGNWLAEGVKGRRNERQNYGRI